MQFIIRIYNIGWILAFGTIIVLAMSWENLF